ncbi:twin-arginine translocase TatA/TatE family subunit [Pseudactinotalea terrae]|uniref:twin-arginine translocase TatA/TatE family subunit n=1 Tax=Pseudactinotalea terrae TaxID=1743262 RepID=UPI0012E2CE0F|nr:twin-arginine translocase TatA/TatE family subunit [Pseudactinotalea terrae]
MSAEEIGIIILLALVVIGPQRLPEYAEQLAKLVKNVRKMATGATETIREELGDEIADLDLTKFDPRQYDPRRIVREALLDDIIPATKPAKKATTTTAAKSNGSTAAKKPGVTPRTRTPKPVSKNGPTAVAGTAAAATATAAAATATIEDAPVGDATIQDAPVEDAPVEDAALALVPSPPLPPFDDEAT